MSPPATLQTQGPSPAGEGVHGVLPVAAIIVSYNRRDDLHLCLSSLRRLKPRLAEVIVVDNGSSDGTAQMVREAFPEVSFHAATGNIGPCLARNAAALATSQPYLWFLDSDTEATAPDIGLRMMEVLAADPAIAGVGGEAVLGRSASGAEQVVGIKPLTIAANSLVYGRPVTAPGLVSCQGIASCNLLVRRNDFMRVGGFDPFYFFFYEDMDLTWRLAHDRARPMPRRLVGLVPMDLVHHYSESERVKQLWRHARNRLYFTIKNRSLANMLALPLNDLLAMVSLDNVRRLLRRSAQSGVAREQVLSDGAATDSQAACPAPSSELETPSPSARSGLAKRLRRMGRLIFGRVALMLLGYPAIVPHLRTALAERRTPSNHLADRAGLLAMIGIDAATAPDNCTKAGEALAGPRA